MTFRLQDVLLIVILVMLMCMSIIGCAGPPTASKIKIGEDFAELPKAGQYNAEYVYTNAQTGEHRMLKITDATVDPSAALRAYSDTQVANLKFFENLVNRISVPGVVAPAAVTATPAPAVVAGPPLPGPAPPVVPR